MISFAVLFRAVLVASFIILGSADDHTTQCVAKFRPVAIDTNDAKGGIARTSFLYVEVEADKKFTVEPRICPEGYIPPTKMYEIQYASSPDNHYGCPDWDDGITCDIPSVPATYEDFLDNPASYSCINVTFPGSGYPWSEVHCSIHDPSHHSSGICCPADKSTLYMRQPTHDDYMSQSDHEGLSDHPMMILGRCTAARFGELHGHDVDLTAVPFDTSDRVSPVVATRMDGRDGRGGPYTIKDVYKKLGDQAKKEVRNSFWAHLLAKDKIVKLTGVKDFTEQEIIDYFDRQELSFDTCNGPNPEDCIERTVTVLSLGGTAFLGFDPDDPDVAEIDFPKLEMWQVGHMLGELSHRNSCWDCGGDSDENDIARKMKFGYKNCPAALYHPPMLVVPPLARDNIAGYFTHFHHEPVPGNKQIRSEMKLTPFKSAVSKEFTSSGTSTCKMLVTLVDVPTMVDPQEIVSIDGIAFSDLTSIYDSVPDAYVVLDAFTVLARTTGKVPGLGTKFTVEVRDTATGSVTIYRNITATPGAYSSLKKRLDARNDKRWEQNFKCGGMDYDRNRGMIKLNDKRFERDLAYHLGGHVDLSTAKGGRDDAIENMKETSISFTFYLGSRSLETGKTSYTFQEENGLWSNSREVLTVKDFEGCYMVVDSCYGDGGGIPLQPAENKCNIERLAEVVDGLNETIAKTEDGTMLTNYADYLQYMGTDAWVDCISIVTNSMEDFWARETQESTECVVSEPCDWMNMDYSNETLVEQCNHGSWAYCKDYPNHEWCKDPCCNHDLQQTMCCAPRNATVSVFRPKLKTADYVFECLSTAFENSKTEEFPNGDLDSLYCVDPTEAAAAADFVASKLQNPKACMTKYLEVNNIVTEINSDLDCCLSAVVGVENWDSGYSMKSTQPCESDDDCYSGKCLITGSGQQKDTPTDDGCAWSATTLTNRCALAGSESSGAAIAHCLTRRLEANNRVTDEAVKTVRKVLGGSSDATDADVGQAITDVAIAQECMGDADGWKYNTHCWGNDCSDCEGETECKAECLAAKACNWKPQSHNQTICEATTGNYCLGTTEWGSSEDLTQSGYCRPSNPTYYGRYESMSNWESEHWRHESTGINDTVCTTVSNDIGAGGLSATAVPWDKWNSEPAKQCTFSGANMNSDKDTCYDDCIGTNGFKPAAKYQCYVDPESTTGKCPTDGYFTVRREDWNFHPPHGLPRPSFCVAKDWALRKQYNDPIYGVTGSNQTNTNWTLTLAGDGTGTVTVTGGPLYNLAGTDWELVTGFSWYHHDGLFLFDDADVAEKVCTDSNVGAKARVVDDGTDQCRTDRCWLKTATNQGACAHVDPSGTSDGYWASWDSKMNGGSGACTFTRWDVRTDTNEISTYQADGTPAVKKFKEFCDAQTSMGGAFYLGREFQKGIMDTESDCNAKYCNIVGKNHQVDNATCTSLGGVCKTRGLGCGGCRAPYSEEVSGSTVKYTMYYRTGVSSSNCATEGGTHDGSSMNLCAYDDPTDSRSKISCEDIDDAVCGATSPDTSTLYGYASDYLKCKATKEKRFCKTKEQCETETGTCSGHWGPQLKEELCQYNETIDTVICTPFSHVCVTTKDKINWECPGHTCVGNPTAHNYTYESYNSTGHLVTVTETHCWDPKREHVSHEKCADYYITSEADCTAVDGEWWSTNMTSQKDFCTSSKRCAGGRSDVGWTGERDGEQCVLCGGRMVQDSTWQSGTWVEPAMVNSGNQWKTRAYEAGVNSWSGRVDQWRVKDLLYTVETSLKEEASSVFARCQYGQVGGSLEQLAGVCSGSSLVQRTKILDKTSKLLNNMTAYNGTEMTIGNAGETNLQPDENSTDGDASYGVDTAIVRLPSDSETLPARCLVTEPNDEGGAVNARARDAAATRRRTARRRLATTGAAATLQDVGCWSRVRNDNDVLVGMLLGECVQVTLGAGQQLLDGVKACLKTKAERSFAEGYTQDLLVKYTKVNGVEKYTPVSTPVERVGTQLCAKITEIGSFFCPARVALNWATATTDIGSNECAIVDVIATAKLAAIERIQKELANSDKDGPIPGLDLASGIAALAAICLVVCGCCAGGRWWFVRRRRRQQARAGKVTVDPTNTLV